MNAISKRTVNGILKSFPPETAGRNLHLQVNAGVRCLCSVSQRLALAVLAGERGVAEAGGSASPCVEVSGPQARPQRREKQSLGCFTRPPLNKEKIKWRENKIFHPNFIHLSQLFI